MRERSKHGAPRPLPREWLPDPHPPDKAPEWGTKVERIMAAADPELRRLGEQRPPSGVTWWSVMGLWWKPAAGLAAAVTALLLLTGRSATSPALPQGSLSLSLVAAEGDPVALWEAFEIQADPVLARIAFEGQRDETGQGTPAPTPEGENR